MQSPPSGPAVTGGAFTFADGTTKNLAFQVGVFRLFESYPTGAATETARPEGSYTLRFNQMGKPERVITMKLPASPTIVPKIANFAEAQAIDPAKDFTLRWNSFFVVGADVVVRLVISDEFGNRIFLAPNQCVPRTLDPAATSVVIPANYLRPGFNYQAQLLFGLNFHHSTTEVTGMTGNGFVQRITAFSIKATSNPGGPQSELCQPATPTLGSYTVTKLLGHRQTSADTVVPQSDNPAFFGATIQSPPAGPTVTNGSLTLPSGTKSNLTSQVGVINLYGAYKTEAALDEAYPKGSYTVRFNQTGEPERVITMTMPATPTAIPRIVNYDEAQAIDAATDFTLKWNPFTPQGSGAFITLIITDERGNLIFLAPNPCVPRTLDPTATSIVIPTKHFHSGSTYVGLLVFGLNFYNSITDVSQMAGYGTVQSTTTFPLKTTDPNGTVPLLPAKFTNYRVLPNGNPEFNLLGTAGKIYTLQRANKVTSQNWNPLGPVTMDAAGMAVFEDTDSGLRSPAFYRAVGN
ncbi:MAG: hypothetical protein EXS31_04275 [Pedosphaera sp.]|nr:hypothetical protein [Pedosphaera sp.]